jgi:hypothetical protein
VGALRSRSESGHICFDVLEWLLAGGPIGRIAGAEAMNFGGWQRLTGEYTKQFGVETPGWAPNARSVEELGSAAARRSNAAAHDAGGAQLLQLTR